MDKKGTLDSVATALASSVFPHPGGPSNSAPFGTYTHNKIYDSEHSTYINTAIMFLGKQSMVDYYFWLCEKYYFR
jgi:hypothetical protein